MLSSQLGPATHPLPSLSPDPHCAPACGSTCPQDGGPPKSLGACSSLPFRRSLFCQRQRQMEVEFWGGPRERRGRTQRHPILPGSRLPGTEQAHMWVRGQEAAAKECRAGLCQCGVQRYPKASLTQATQQVSPHLTCLCPPKPQLTPPVPHRSSSKPDPGHPREGHQAGS